MSDNGEEDAELLNRWTRKCQTNWLQYFTVFSHVKFVNLYRILSRFQTVSFVVFSFFSYIWVSTNTPAVVRRLCLFSSCDDDKPAAV